MNSMFPIHKTIEFQPSLHLYHESYIFLLQEKIIKGKKHFQKHLRGFALRRVAHKLLQRAFVLQNK